MARSVGLEDVDQANVDELLQSHLSEITNEDLLEMENDRENDKEGELSVEPIKHLSTAQLTEFFQHTDNAIKIIEENDPNTDRSAKVSREIQNSLACYKELYRERKNAARQTSLDHFLTKAENHQPSIPGPSREQESDPDSQEPVPVSCD